jgi:hypothetical protein
MADVAFGRVVIACILGLINTLRGHLAAAVLA